MPWPYTARTQQLTFSPFAPLMGMATSMNYGATFAGYAPHTRLMHFLHLA
jgi:hypothetical protein